MRFPKKEEVERLRRQFPVGSRIVLDEMDDPYTRIPPGTQGIVEGVDDAGNILCRWDTGNHLSVAYGADRAHVATSEEEMKVSLAHLGKRQKKATCGGTCPRCGTPLATFRGHAVSRRAPVTICDMCGQKEALEDAGLMPKLSLSKWRYFRDWKL